LSFADNRIVFNLFFHYAYLCYSSSYPGFFFIADVTGDGDGCQRADDGHHDHQLHQGDSFQFSVSPIFSCTRYQSTSDSRLKKLKKKRFQSRHPC